MRASIVLLSFVLVAVALPGLAAAQPDVYVPYSCNVTWIEVAQVSAPGTPYNGYGIWVPRVECYG